MSLAPIAIFAYNRPVHLKRLLDSLRENRSADISPIFIYCDGRKQNASQETIEQIDQVAAVAGSIDWNENVKVILHKENRGLAKSIISGIFEVLSTYESIIVLEDDLILSPLFLEYMNENLVRFKDDKKVMHISGFVPPLNFKENQVLIYGGTSTWGWATWRDSWLNYEPNAIIHMKKLNTKKLIRSFNFSNSYDYLRMLQEQIDGKIRTWDIQWYATVFFNGGYGIWPQKSYVQTTGHDGSGEHCVDTDIYRHDHLADTILERSFKKTKEDKQARKELIMFYRSKVNMLKGNIFTRIMNKLKTRFQNMGK